MFYKIFRKTAKSIGKLVVVSLIFVFFITPLAPAFANVLDDISNPVIVGTPVALSTETGMLTVNAVPPATNNNLSQDNAVVGLPTDPLFPDSIPSNTVLNIPTTNQNTPDNVSSDEDIKKDKAAFPQSQAMAVSLSEQGNSAPVSSSNSSLSQKLPEIDKNTGALNYSYSIAIPPGRNNVQPNLALSYNSNSNEQNSIFGYGWALNIPFIQRMNKAGVDTLYDASAVSYFYSSLDGELLTTGGSSFIARTENGSFNKYTFLNNQWVITAKDGTRYTFGADNSGRQNDPQNAGNIYKWMLQEVRDANDNYISYSYFKDVGQIYPSVIKYTGNGSTDGIFEVNFQRALRPDNAPHFTTGFSVASNYYINEINAKINGNWVTKYVLSYTASANSNRSLLSSITMSGQDASGNITSLLPTTFNYQNSGAGFSPTNSTWHFPSVDFRPEEPVYFTDLNGDGLTDVILVKLISANPNVYQNYNYINNGNGYTENSSWRFPMTDFLDQHPAQLVDLNGDSLTDLVLIKPINISQGIYENYEYINNGSNWVAAGSSWHFPNISFLPRIAPQFTDINSDGLTDLILIERVSTNPDSFLNYTYLNNGNGWTENASWAFPFTEYLGILPPYFTDLNGDGLTDLVLIKPISSNPDTYENYEYLNNGAGWTQSSIWHFPSADFRPDLPLHFADLNSDGLTDLILIKLISSGPNSYENYEYLNNGAGWTQSFSWHFPNTGFFLELPVYFADINGDGLTDLAVIDRLGSNSYVYENYEYLNNGKRQDLLYQITYPQGGNTTVTYKAAAQYTDGSGNPTNKSPYPIFTVSQITNNDGFGNTSNFSYQYQGGTYYYQGPFDKQFSGYQTIIQTDSAGNVTKTYYHTGRGNDSAHGQFQDDYWKIGKPYRVEQYDNAGNLFSKTINKWDDVDLGSSGSKFVMLAQTLHGTHDGDATHRDTAESYTYDTTKGNLIKTIQYGEVTGNDNGTFADIGNDTFTTSYTYATEASNSKFQVSSQKTTDQNTNKIKESKYYYDGLSFGILTKGNLTKQEDWKSGTTYINSQKTYNSYGLVAVSTDPRGKTTQYVYDAYNLYPAIITNALGQMEQYVYDYAFSQITQKTDINSRVFQYTYDGIGRLAEEKQPDLTASSTLVTKAKYIYIDTPNAVIVQKSNYLDALNTVDSYTYFDGLSRKIQDRQEAEGINFSVKDYVYNNLGQLQKESLPYFSTGSSKTSLTTDSTLYTNYAYDATGRVVTLTNAVGATTNAYSDWKLTVTDANGKSKDLYKDAYGNLIQVDEHNSGSTYSTYYTYDYLGNLTKLTDALNNVRNFTYDGLGRRLTGQDLHALPDITFGNWIYTYDDAGNLTQTIDPKNQTINYTYDNINRQLTEDYIGQAGVEVVNTYDNGVDGKGHLTGFVSLSLSQNNAYNALGLLKTESKIISSSTYLTTYDYDRQGNQITIINPDNSQVKNIYNSAGLLEKTQRKENTDASFIDVANNFDYSPTAQVANIDYTNGAVTINTYDSTKLYRLTNKVTTIVGGIKAQDLSYTYDAVGNITQIIDNSATDSKKTSNYTYDDLYRLVSATATNVATGQQTYSQIFNYDGLGNILTKNETIGTNPAIISTYSYAGNTGNNYANPHAVTSMNDGAKTTNYVYDNNGNMTQEGTKLYTFDYNNRLTQASIPGLTETITPVSSTSTSTQTTTPTSTPITAVFYPQAGDGYVYYTSTSWATTHNATTGNSANYTGTTLKVSVGKYTSASIRYKIERALLPFDTSSLPDDAVVTSAKLKVYVSSKLNDDNDGDDWVTVAQGSEQSPIALTATDYSKAGLVNNPIEGIDITERKDITNVATGQYLVFNLNDTGKSWISKTSSTKIALREGHDAIDSAFTGSSDKYNRLIIRTSEYIGTEFDPILEITYTMPTPTQTSTPELLPAPEPMPTPEPLLMPEPTLTPTPTPITTTFYPKAGDGSVYYNNSTSLSWSAIHDAAKGNSASYKGTTFKVNSGKYVSTSYKIERAFLPFDTSSLPDDAAITSAKLKVFVESKLNDDNDGDDWITLVQGSEASITKLTTVDYDNAGLVNNPQEGIDMIERKDITDVTTGQYLVFNLNTAGESWISKISPTKLALREGHDVINSVFTGAIGQYNQLKLRSSEYNGVSSDPVLEVTYIIPIPAPTPVIPTFTVAPTTITAGQSATLSWTLSGGAPTTLSIDNAVGSVLGTSSKAVSPTSTTAYTITATNAVGTAIKSVTVTVNPLSPPPPPPALTIITYAYDASGQRVKVISTNTGVTTTYPTKFYNTTFLTSNIQNPTSIVKHIFANGQGLATIEGSGASTAVYYNHSDLLQSSNVMTDSAGAIAETMDYFPFGGIRIDQKASTFNEQRQYIGQEYDQDTGLNYLNARYYNATLARFISEDSQFWGNQNLTDPQTLNSYSYGSNNPITMSDPTGQFSIRQAGMFALGFTNAYFSDNLGGFRRGNSSDSYYTAGQSYGDKLAMAQGAAEISAALSAVPTVTTGGFALAPPTGGLSLVGAATIDMGAIAIAGHGFGTSAIAGYNLSKGKSGNLSEENSNNKANPDLKNLNQKVSKQMEQRGWTQEQIKEAFNSGEQIPAINKANNSSATRYVHPNTGQSVVIENKTGEVVHVGGQGFKYGSASGDIIK